ncbi:Oidioi.mRNA.OKI2018_I69.XSR.g14397.t2.cds [Oikopleura dioica]|uniref:Oidioi.mRNA.OKI2018_I69.XSR.g14397.t2.cds n=1 Tax=Oikopleura dioica TaxID=34765 RepID=A0ABN7SEL9_OIKDI|nr:Oidioi.mRNA.OKI2018_I69.XSR.g14397.t2.cds [Oikopleura dioica]
MNANYEEEVNDENVFTPFDFASQAWNVDDGSIYVADSSTIRVKNGAEERTVPLKSLEADVRSCKRGGNSDESCDNTITNVQVCPDKEAQIVACGTNALQPEVFFLENATETKRHTQQLCPKSAKIDALVKVTSCGDEPAKIQGVAVHTERDSTKIITSSHIFDLKLSSPKFVHISSSDATGANYLYFFTETSSAGDLASFVGFTCNGGGASNLIKIPLKCSREDFVFAKMKQVVETDSMFHVLFETPFNLYKKTTICSYSFQNDFLPVIKNARCDSSHNSDAKIAQTPILEDRGSESESGPYTSISTIWDNVLLLGTQKGEIITATRDSSGAFNISSSRKLTHDKCAGAVLDLKSTIVDDVATVFAAFETCIASVPISDCSSLSTSCCKRTPFCEIIDDDCTQTLTDSPISLSDGSCLAKELRAQDGCICPQNATVPVAIVGLIVAFVAFVGGYFWGKCSFKPQDELHEYMDDSEWGITNTLSASSSSTAKTRTRIKTSPSKQSATLRSNRSDEGAETVSGARTIPVMGVSSIGSNRDPTLSPRRSADGSITHESRA